MPLIKAEAALATALLDKVRRKANRTRKLRLVAGRVTRGVPEVMVKITGFGKGGGHVRAHLEYITRNGKIELENERGEVFTGKAEVNALFKDWERDFAEGKRHQNQRDTMHLVLSMPESTDPESVHNAVREFAKATFGDTHDYVFALHTDEPHPHCHVTVKLLGYDGKRLNPRKDDLREWREGFAEALRDQGVEAEATPRPSRGVVKRPENPIIRHILKGDKTHQPRPSKAKALRELEAIEEIQAEAHGQPPKARPWEAKIKEQQTVIRGAWLSAAKQLQQSSEPDDQTLAVGIRGFVAAMPKIDTERHEIKARLIERFSQQRARGEGKVENVPVPTALNIQKVYSEELATAKNAGKDLEF